MVKKYKELTLAEKQEIIAYYFKPHTAKQTKQKFNLSSKYVLGDILKEFGLEKHNTSTFTALRDKVVCDICGKEISINNINGHLNSHKTHPEYHFKEHQSVTHEGLNCIYCNKNYKNKNSLAQHECRCKENPNHYQVPKNFITFTAEHTAWNKGLTKQTDERLAKQSITLKSKISTGEIKHHSVSGRPDVREKLSKAAKENLRTGKVVPISHSRAKHGWYKGYWCDSAWELAYVIYNLEHNVIFERNSDHFEYLFENKTYLYFPDFKLSDGTYIEIKGYADKKFIEKAAQFPKNKKLIVLYKDNIKTELDYVIKKYGPDYYRLYESTTSNN